MHLAPRTMHRLATRANWTIAAFYALLGLALVWPLPIVAINERWLDLPLSVDRDSFLGREAPAWDAVFWSVTGLFVIAMFHGRLGEVREGWRLAMLETISVPRRLLAQARSISPFPAIASTIGFVVLVAVIWLVWDSAGIALAERVQSDGTRTAGRMLNRFAGGMNPALIAGFLALGGITFVKRRWLVLALGIAVAGLGGGMLVQVIKLVVGRTRPELWMGPFHHARAAASSFPSGHTVGAFAIAGVLIFGSRSPWLRWFAALVAIGAGLSRILSFRHWLSDVFASAVIGLGLAWFFIKAMGPDPERSEGPPAI